MLLHMIVVVARVVFAVLLTAAGVVSGLLGVYFLLNHNARLFDGAPLLLVAGVIFAVACFSAARNLLRANEPDATTA
jgi:hypothetical protein